MFIHTAGPNTALVKSTGKIVIGSRLFAVPVFQRVDKLKLNLRTITVRTESGTSVNGVQVHVTACCQVKIQGWATPPPSSTSRNALPPDYHALKLAAQHFIGKSDSEIEESIRLTVEGHQRAIIGTLTIEQLYRDRAAFSSQVKDHCDDDMRNMGLVIVSYTVAEIADEQGYIKALGVTQIEKIKREATEGAAKHQEMARTHRGELYAASHLLINEQQERKIESDKQKAFVETEAKREIDKRLVLQRKAKLITSAEQDAVVLVERQKARSAETEAERVVMAFKVEKERLEKDRVVRVEADARLYRAKVEAAATRASTAAEAHRLREIGIAEAAAIRAKGKAEMVALKDRINMWNEHGNEGVILERLMDVLPEVAAAVVAPLEQTEKMVFIGHGESDEHDAKGLLSEPRIAELQETLSAITGINPARICEVISRSELASRSVETATGHKLLSSAPAK